VQCFICVGRVSVAVAGTPRERQSPVVQPAAAGARAVGGQPAVDPHPPDGGSLGRPGAGASVQAAAHRPVARHRVAGRLDLQLRRRVGGRFGGCATCVVRHLYMVRAESVLYNCCVHVIQCACVGGKTTGPVWHEQCGRSPSRPWRRPRCGAKAAHSCCR